MRTWLALLLALSIVGCRERRETTPLADPASRRSTPSGDVQGFVGRYGSYVWLGIPYAAPPVGDLRWRGPTPPAAWSGVRDATRFGSPCVQYASPMGGIQTAPANTPVGDEDCLYLNVYAPTAAKQTSFLPVMLWIHGGGNSIGSGQLYDGGNLAALKNVVVVTVNYRLGPFGWFRQSAVRTDADSDAERSGNFGTLDLVRALEWIEGNIAVFGGDPAKVTIFGESAGGTNVASLLLSPSAVGLFHRAIIQSGGLHMSDPVSAEAFADAPTAETANSSSEAVARMLISAKVATDRGDAKAKVGGMPRAEMTKRLRALSARDVLTAYVPEPGIGMIRIPTVFRDDTVVPSGDLLATFRRAAGWNRVPVIIGTNRDENKTFMYASPAWTKRWFGIVPRSIEPAAYDAVASALATLWSATGGDEIAQAMVDSDFKDVYRYRFDWDEEPTILGTDLAHMIGAGHGIEIPFVFGHFDLGREANRMFTAENEAGRVELAAAMMSYWAAFAKSGEPGRGDGTRPEWPRWSASHETLVLDTPAGGGITRTQTSLTQQAVLDSIDKDPRFADARLRCLVFHDFVLWTPALTRGAYDAKCQKFPFDAYPWRS
jgi:para-nitrobenzyl esterase